MSILSIGLVDKISESRYDSGRWPVASGRVDDGQTNSVLFHLSVWPSSTVPSIELRTYGPVRAPGSFNHNHNRR